MEFIRFIFALGLLFGAGIFIMRWLTGWNAIERSYRSNLKPPSDWISNGSYRWVTGSVQGTRIGLAIEVYPEAPWLRTSFPLSISLRPLCIPWHAIESIDQDVRILGGKTSLKIVGVDFPLYISGAAGATISDVYQLNKAARCAT